MAEKQKPVAINHVGLHASDPQHSVTWFQGLFGFPVVARQGHTAILRIGDGPQYMAVHGKPDKNPGYTHFGFSIDDFNAEELTANLRELGLTPSHFPGPMQFTVRNRGSELGGAPEGTPEVFIGDPDGIIVQVQDTKYCGGSGPLGDVGYATPEPAPTEGIIRTIECNHCTLGVSDGAKSLEFYQEIFDMPVDTYQGPTPILRVGSGNASLVLFDLNVPEAKGVKPCIDHVCFAVESFDVDRIEKALGEYGLEVLGQAFRSTGPLQTYYTARMPDRGGDPHGTNELYFTDPDGTVVQLQDVRYAGGCGSLGEIRGTGVKHPFESMDDA